MGYVPLNYTHIPDTVYNIQYYVLRLYLKARVPSSLLRISQAIVGNETFAARTWQS